MARGRPFKKGQSGNPDGRPKLPAEIKAGCRRLALMGFARFEEALRDPRTPLPIVFHMTKLMAAYGYGTPVNSDVARESDEDSGITVEIVHFEDLPPEEPKPNNVVAISAPKPKR